MPRQGSTMLKVVSIIMIVFAAIHLMTILLMTAMFSDISVLSGTSLWELIEKSGLSSADLVISQICLLLAAVLELIAGIFGVLNWFRKEKAGICSAFGWSIIVLTLVGIILEIVFFGRLMSETTFGYASFSASISIGGILNLVLPVLYLVGAGKLKNLQPQPAYYGQYYNGYGGYQQQYGTYYNPSGQPYGGQYTNPGQQYNGQYYNPGQQNGQYYNPSGQGQNSGNNQQFQ